MVPLNSRLNFVPSEDVKKFWPYTYSSGNNYGGVQLPGLFKTSLFPLHAICFGLVIFGELYGYMKIRELGTGSITQIFLGFIAVDFFLVILAIFLLGKIKKIDNLLVLVNDEADKLTLERKKWIRQNLFLLIIKTILIGIALFKIYAYLDLKHISLSDLFRHGDAIPIIVLYILVALLHMFTTAYFFTYCFLWIRVKLQEMKYGNDRQSHGISSHIVRSLPTGVKFKEAKDKASLNYHYVTKKVKDPNTGELIDDENPETKDNFKLMTWGILTDKQLENLIWQQEDPDLKRELALAGLEHQLALIGIDKTKVQSIN